MVARKTAGMPGAQPITGIELVGRHVPGADDLDRTLSAGAFREQHLR
jgi:hypothetical protein